MRPCGARTRPSIPRCGKPWPWRLIKRPSVPPDIGFLAANKSIYNQESYGWRKGRAEQPAPYDPARAKQLLAEAGYPNGFETTAHFAEFPGRPNQREAMDIIASNWKAIGVNVKVIEHDPSKYYADQDAGKRAYLPINEWTWGRQENGIFLAQIAYSSSGFRSLYNERTDALVQKLSQTLDQEEQLKLLAESRGRSLPQPLDCAAV